MGISIFPYRTLVSQQCVSFGMPSLGMEVFRGLIPALEMIALAGRKEAAEDFRGIGTGIGIGDIGREADRE